MMDDASTDSDADERSDILVVVAVMGERCQWGHGREVCRRATLPSHCWGGVEGGNSVQQKPQLWSVVF